MLNREEQQFMNVFKSLRRQRFWVGLRRNTLCLLALCIVSFHSAAEQVEVGTYDPQTEEWVIEPRETALIEIEWQLWMDQIWCRLLENGSPMARVLTSFMIDLRQYWQHNDLNDAGHFSCAASSDQRDPRVIRYQALHDDPENPVLLSLVFASDCQDIEPASWCETEELAQQLRVLDPDNGFVLMLPVYLSSGEGEALPFLARERELLRQAAATTRYDDFVGKGMLGVHHEVVAAVAEVGDFEPSEEALIQAAESEWNEDFDVTDPSWPTIALQTGVFARAGTTSGRVLEGCKAAVRDNDAITVQDCQTLGTLMQQTANSEISRVMGTGLVRTSSATEHHETPLEKDSPEALRKLLQGLIRVCESPRGIINDGTLSGAMPEDHLEQWLADLEASDERIAARHAAFREYDLYPEDFKLDPRRCADILNLDELTQRQIVDIWHSRDVLEGDSREDAFEAAAIALDSANHNQTQ